MGHKIFIAKFLIKIKGFELLNSFEIGKERRGGGKERERRKEGRRREKRVRII